MAADAATLAIAVGLELFGVVSRALGLNAEPAATRAEQCEHARGPPRTGSKYHALEHDFLLSSKMGRLKMGCLVFSIAKIRGERLAAGQASSGAG